MFHLNSETIRHQHKEPVVLVLCHQVQLRLTRVRVDGREQYELKVPHLIQRGDLEPTALKSGRTAEDNGTDNFTTFATGTSEV